jgi:hypothetical protein
MEQCLPFPVTVRPWDELSDWDRKFFSFQDDYLPLHPNHAAQIGLLEPEDALRVENLAYASLPRGWPNGGQYFAHEEKLWVGDSWNDADAEADVRRWLYGRGVPYRRTVYLLYEPTEVVQTTWRLLIRYWDAFAWSVGSQMEAFDHTLSWACCFHHEDVIVFGSHSRTDRE